MNDQLLALRRDLHAHPELSGNEKETIKRIKTFVHKQTGLEGTDVGGYGSCYTFNYGKGNHLLVRVDIDGLPIQEVNDFEYVSKTKGVSHKCGHDGHAAIGAGLVIKLHNEPLKHGKLTVLFQPAEEIGEGAKSVLNDPSFDISAFD
ncbi:MAG: M20/M25/M40 family metallo-hydrolase, partial [Salibacteraceae bacterium]